MNPKQILILSVLAGLLAVVLVQVQLRNERGQSITLFRATETVEAGEALGSRVETVALPGDKLFPNLLKEAPTAEMADYVTSTALRQTVQAGQIVLYRHLDSIADPGIRVQVPPGKKAIAIEVDPASAVAFFLEPGDWVDVLAALPKNETAEHASLDLSRLDGLPKPSVGRDDVANLEKFFSQRATLDGNLMSFLTGPESDEDLETRVLLEQIEILAVGGRYRRAEPGDPETGYNTVTLLVSAEEATRIAHARNVVGSPLTLILRSPEDDMGAGAVPQGETR